MEDKTLARQLLEKLAATKGASDLICTVGKPPQLRVYNELHSIRERSLGPEETMDICFSLLNEEQAERFKKEKEIDLSVWFEGVARYRVNMYYQLGFVGMAARLVMEEIKDFTSLGLPDIVRKFSTFPNGLILITGPVGSGKSTTVAAMVNHINMIRSCHVVCIEDPVEFIHVNQSATIDQREVGSDTHSYHEALKRVLRQSMDVVIVGEIRDQESAQAAMTLAETGHLTIATLHTRGTIASVNRLIDMFPPEQGHQVRTQLSASLRGVIWQQLIPGVDEGLVAACEVLYVTPAIRSLIRQGRTQEVYSAIQTGKQYQMTTMEDSLKELVSIGKIRPDWSDHNAADAIVVGEV